MATKCARATVILALALVARPAAAQETPSPSPSPAAQNAPVWHNPASTPYSILDPCAGPKELLSKINPSPCVLVLGQAQVSFGYANVNTHGTVSLAGPQQNGFVLPIAGNANVYPSLTIAAGVSSRSQFQITVPSYVAISTARLGSTSAASDTAFNYKQLVYFSPTKFTLAAVAVGYTAPTGTSSIGPSYSIQPQLGQPLNLNLTVGAFWTFQNADMNNAGTIQRGWSDPFGVYLAWAPARADFAILPIVTHSFNPNLTTFMLDGAYLFNRHTLLNLAYGGLGASSSTALPFTPSLTFATNVNPRVFASTLYFLIGGESNLPPMPPPAAAPASPEVK